MCRVLDPACGDGAFLLEAFDELCLRHERDETARLGADELSADEGAAERRLAIVRDQIFGVDIDPPAVLVLRDRLLERLRPAACFTAEGARALEANIRCGDSLSGPDFGTRQEETALCSSPGRRSPQEGTTLAGCSEARRFNPAGPPAIDWRRDFRTAAAAGGFDLVIGNPPYLREKNAKPLFDALATTDLGQRWREARMDLWYYFVHRGLDLVRPEGILSFIVSSYWLSSRGARRLIARLERETRLKEIVLLDKARVFNGIAGRHMIFQVQKSSAPEGGATGTTRSECRLTLVRPGDPEPRTSGEGWFQGAETFGIPHSELFQQGRLIVAPPAPAHALFRGRPTLGEFFETRQGMAENPPFINRRLHGELGGIFPIGTGVFVLRPDEIKSLGLSPAERSLLRPYYETSAIARYRLPDRPTHQVLYLTRRTAANLDLLPNAAAHLARFRAVLDRRRETRNGSCHWWQLHWPREERIFLSPRVLSVQMGAAPQFALAEQPTFVGFSVNVVLPRGPDTFALDALTGILNSRLAALWFERHAKRRGRNLEINAHVLREFPLPARNAAIERRLGELVRLRQKSAADSACAEPLERELDELVGRLYATPGNDS
jgi:adenine-specific DNA-methyltransferase